MELGSSQRKWSQTRFHRGNSNYSLSGSNKRCPTEVLRVWEVGTPGYSQWEFSVSSAALEGQILWLEQMLIHGKADTGSIRRKLDGTAGLCQQGIGIWRARIDFPGMQDEGFSGGLLKLDSMEQPVLENSKHPEGAPGELEGDFTVLYFYLYLALKWFSAPARFATKLHSRWKRSPKNSIYGREKIPKLVKLH